MNLNSSIRCSKIKYYFNKATCQTIRLWIMITMNGDMTTRRVACNGELIRDLMISKSHNMIASR